MRDLRAKCDRGGVDCHLGGDEQPALVLASAVMALVIVLLSAPVGHIAMPALAVMSVKVFGMSRGTTASG